MATLADDLMAACAHPTKKVGEDNLTAQMQRDTAANIQARLRRSHRYTLDDEVVTAAAALSVLHPAILLQMLGSARLPFSAVFFEYRTAVMIENIIAWNRSDSTGIHPKNHLTYRTGIFIEQRDDEYVYQAIGLPKDANARLDYCSIGMRCRIDRPYSDDDQNTAIIKLAALTTLPESLLRMTRSGKMIMRSVADGQFAQEPSDAESEQREAIAETIARHTITEVSERHREYQRLGRSYALTHPNWYQERARTLIPAQSVILRLMLAMLVLINTREHVVTTVVAPEKKSRLIGGKAVPLLEYRTATLKLGVDQTVREVSRSFARAVPNPKRAHDVRGHWAHTRDPGRLRNLDCGDDHEYRELTLNRQECLLCGARRWWRADHQRGDEKLGHVISETKVVL